MGRDLHFNFDLHTIFTVSFYVYIYTYKILILSVECATVVERVIFIVATSINESEQGK